jgi:hypothetical protein
MDNNLFSVSGQKDFEIHLPFLFASPEHQDALHISASEDGTVYCGQLVGGTEDCVDVNNHCKRITVIAEFEPKGKYVITVKGGSEDIAFVGSVKGHGTEVDVDIGNISDQSDNLTKRVKLHLVHQDKEPITVRCIGGPRPILLNEEEQGYAVVFEVPGFWQSWALKGLKQLKKLKFFVL